MKVGVGLHIAIPALRQSSNLLTESEAYLALFVWSIARLLGTIRCVMSPVSQSGYVQAGTGSAHVIFHSERHGRDSFAFGGVFSSLLIFGNKTKIKLISAWKGSEGGLFALAFSNLRI